MPSELPRVAAYLQTPIHQKLTEFCEAQELSQSQAINQILAEYFGVLPSDTLSHTPKSEARLSAVEGELLTVREQLSSLTQAVEGLQKQVGRIPSELPSSTPKADAQLSGDSPDSSPGSSPVSELPSESLSSVPESLTQLSGEFPSNLPSDIPASLNRNQLAKRLGCTKSNMTYQLRKGDETAFIAWSQEKDPDGIGWRYESQTQLCFPVTR